MMKKIILSCLLVCLALITYAQSRFEYKHAYKLFHKFAYADAAKAYQRIYQQESSDSLCIRIAQCYAQLNAPNEVAVWYGKTRKKENLQPDDLINYGQALETLGDYEQAKHWYSIHQKQAPGDTRVRHKITGIENLSTYFQDSAQYKIISLNINGDSYDFAPAFYHKGIAFVSSRRNQLGVNRKSQWDNSYFLDIYYAHPYRQNRFQPPLPFNTRINTRMHEGAMSFNTDGTQMVFTRNNYIKRKEGTTEEGVTNLKLYFAQKPKGQDPGLAAWTDIKEFPYNSDMYSVGEPSVSADFRKIIFISDMPGGQGGTDLYISVYEQGAWTKPVNLGPTFNTEGDERSPFIAADGRIFFASDGRGGLGGLDIYEASPTEDGYIIKNMGYPLNTRMDDFGLIIDTESNKGYFTSNRPGGAGLDDIYAFEIKKKPKVKIEGSVYQLPQGAFDNEKMPLSQATVRIMDLKTRKLTDQQYSNDHGQFYTELSIGSQYAFVGARNGFTQDSVLLDLRNTEEGADFRVSLTLAALQDSALADNKSNPEAPKSRVEVCIEVRGKDTHEPLAGSSVYIMDLKTKKQGIFVTDEEGRICTMLERQATYAVKATQTKYLADHIVIQTEDTQEKSLQPSRPLLLEKLKISQKFVYNQIYFDRDSFNIRADAAMELDKIVRFIKSHPEISVELSAHTDARGTNMYNEALSLKRAYNSRSYIVNHGIDPELITAKGYGEYMLLNDCVDYAPCPEEEHQKNRRTEIRITGIQESMEGETGQPLAEQQLDPHVDYIKEYPYTSLIPASKSLSVK